MGRRKGRFGRAMAFAAVRACCTEKDQIGRMRYVGRGGTYTAYHVEVQRGPRDDDDWVGLIARVPFPPLDAEELRAAEQEVRILGQLAHETLPFRIPAVHGHVEIEGRHVMVQEACYGWPLPKRKQGSRDPLAMLTTIAAAVHAVDIHAWPDGVFDERRSRRAHAERLRAQAADGAPATFDAALAFVDEHLPEDRPGVLLHGDLRPPNVHEDAMEGPAVLDWSLAACGDPAFDLAVILDGRRTPFGEVDGHERALELYNRAAPEPLARTAIHVHELLRKMVRYAYLARSDASDAHLAQEERIVRGLLKRARAARR